VARTSAAARGIMAAVLYPLLFFSGLYYPVQLLPGALQAISHFTPLGAAVQAMQAAMNVGFPSGDTTPSTGGLRAGVRLPGQALLPLGVAQKTIVDRYLPQRAATIHDPLYPVARQTTLERFERFWAAVIDSFATNRQVWLATFDIFTVAQRGPQIRAAVADGIEDARQFWAQTLHGVDPADREHLTALCDASSEAPAGPVGRSQPTRWNIGAVLSDPMEHWGGCNRARHRQRGG
jgi:ABC-2 type transporter